jgi:hypothetical protein
MGIDSLIESAWDLTPYSFILDWFVNVGDTMMSWMPNFGFKNLASWNVVRTTETQKTSIVGSYAAEGISGLYKYTTSEFTIGIGSATRILTTVERTPNYSLPVIPQYVGKLSPAKLLDLGIILSGLKSSASYVKTGM